MPTADQNKSLRPNNDRKLKMGRKTNNKEIYKKIQEEQKKCDVYFIREKNRM